jgi:uncharacterized protein (TIGR03437 family)
MSVLLTSGDGGTLHSSFAVRSPGKSSLSFIRHYPEGFVKLVSRFQCAVTSFILVVTAFSLVFAQTPSATPDPFVTQLTSNPLAFNTFAGDFSGNGRLVVFESDGNLDTQNPRNADGNREIFIADYAQRRIFQITDTKNVPKPPASPTPTPTPTATPTPSPSATPTPTPGPTPADPTLIKIEISNNHPALTFEPTLVAGKRTYTIVFSSNAPTPGSYLGEDTPAIAANANQEIWTYTLPEIDDNFDLTAGDEIPLTPLTGGAFRQITDTPTSRPIRTGTNPPDAVDDNRDAVISDNGTTIAFISTRNIVTGVGNADGNPELFLARTSTNFGTGTFSITQGTQTADVFVQPKTFAAFQQNPSLSADGSVVAFSSSANLASDNDDTGHTNGNAEVFVANFNGSAVGNFRQLTKTKVETNGSTVNLLNAGRRLSRDGKFVAYESRAEDPIANNGTNNSFFATFASDVPTSSTTNPTPKMVGPRALVFPGDVVHFPTFGDYDSALAPHSIVFASALNFKPDGTFPPADQDSTGLNPVPSGTARPNQIFSTQFPITSSNTFTRLTKNPITGFVVGIRPLVSNTTRRIAFSFDSVELGTGNLDGSPEIYYLYSPAVNAESTAALSFFTGASNMGPMASASPTASPTPTPTPSPGVPVGLAPGELSKIRSTVGLATSDKDAVGGSETARSPILPTELNGVSVSVNGAAAGLYFVGDSPSEGINFVMPIGLSTGVATVLVNDQRNNSGTVFRGFVPIVATQPDIFTSTNDAGGVAMVCNITNTAVSGCVTGPFQLTTADSTGTQVPTKLEIYVTGLRNIVTGETSVNFINGSTTTTILPTSVRANTNMFGVDLITIVLPSTLGPVTAPTDFKLVVTVNRSGSFSSRPADTAPTVTLVPGP